MPLMRLYPLSVPWTSVEDLLSLCAVPEVCRFRYEAQKQVLDWACPRSVFASTGRGLISLDDIRRFPDLDRHPGFALSCICVVKLRPLVPSGPMLSGWLSMLSGVASQLCVAHLGIEILLPLLQCQVEVVLKMSARLQLFSSIRIYTICFESPL